VEAGAATLGAARLGPREQGEQRPSSRWAGGGRRSARAAGGREAHGVAGGAQAAAQRGLAGPSEAWAGERVARQ
jgi:hypothetical protein